MCLSIICLSVCLPSLVLLLLLQSSIYLRPALLGESSGRREGALLVPNCECLTEAGHRVFVMLNRHTVDPESLGAGPEVLYLTHILPAGLTTPAGGTQELSGCQQSPERTIFWASVLPGPQGPGGHSPECDGRMTQVTLKCPPKWRLRDSLSPEREGVSPAALGAAGLRPLLPVPPGLPPPGRTPVRGLPARCSRSGAAEPTATAVADTALPSLGLPVALRGRTHRTLGTISR